MDIYNELKKEIIIYNNLKYYIIKKNKEIINLKKEILNLKYEIIKYKENSFLSPCKRRQGLL
jgi:hypothetical protein